MRFPWLPFLLVLGTAYAPSGVLENLEGPADDPMLLPSQALSLSRGRTIVLDGANGRMAIFRVGGIFQEYWGRKGAREGELMNPVGFCRGPEGTVLVADTGNHRIQIWDEDGRFAKSLPLEGLPRRARPTGVAFNPLDDRIYVTDGSNHCVLVLAAPDYRISKTINLEPGPDDIPAYPCFPLFKGGKLYLSEPLNGRIRIIEDPGRTSRFIGMELYRPKGLAADGEGRLFVSDGWRGTVSIFSPGGEYLGLLGNEGGGKRRFASPSGLAFDERGGLLVVEMEKHRVLRLEVEVVSHELPKEPPERPRCLICHPDGIEENGPKSLAGRPAMCLSCHDGTVAEHRATVFAEHGHNGMNGPRTRDLDPLRGVTCMTCHEAHATKGDDFDMASTIFLRYPGPERDFCRLCHGILDQEEEVHYMGPMDDPLPESLVRAGAAPPRGVQGYVHCRTCHLAHGKGEDFLVVGGFSSLCMTCHSRVEHEKEAHARSGLLACRDCHRAHAKKEGGRFRSKPGGKEKPCASCHRDKAVIDETSHDLSRTGEDCLVCHSPYTPYWALGGALHQERQCLACHASGGPFSGKPVESRQHPGGKIPVTKGESRVQEIICATCHDPHSNHRLFLRPRKAQTLCAPCHGPKALWLYLNYHEK